MEPGSAPPASLQPPLPDPFLLTAINKPVCSSCCLRGVSGLGATGFPPPHPCLQARRGGPGPAALTGLGVAGCRLCSCREGKVVPVLPPYTQAEARRGCSCTNATRELYSHQDTKLYFSRNFSSCSSDKVGSTQRGAGAGPAPPCTHCSPSVGDSCLLLPPTLVQRGRGLMQERQVGVQESGWGGPTVNSRHHYLVPSSAGDGGHKPSSLCGGCRYNRAPCPAHRGAEACVPGEKGVGGGWKRGEKQSQQHRQRFTGRAAPQAGQGEHAKLGGMGGR